MSMKRVEWNPSQSSLYKMVHHVQLRTARTPSCFFFYLMLLCDQQLKIWASDIRSSQMFCVPGTNHPFLKTALKSFGVLSPVMWPSGGWSAELPDLQSSGSTEAPAGLPTSGLGERQPHLRDTSHLFQMTGGRQCVIKSFPPLLRLSLPSSRGMRRLFSSSSSCTFPNVRFSLQAAGVPQFPN